jgi:hypothetical protein
MYVTAMYEISKSTKALQLPENNITLAFSRRLFLKIPWLNPFSQAKSNNNWSGSIAVGC